MKFLSLGTIILGKLVIYGRRHYRVTETDIHLEAKHSITVKMCAAYKFCVELSNTEIVYCYSKALFFVIASYY